MNSWHVTKKPFLSFAYIFILTNLLILLTVTSCSLKKSTVNENAATAEYSFALDDILPVEPAVTIGKLDNGLTYFIRENEKPEKRLELRLVINAGSILEDDNQRGLAHFVEHMAFNGTKQFEKQELVNYLESIGMRFGPDLNAYTGFDETVFILQVPTDSLHIVETAFQILEDWAHYISFDDEEIDKERGVITEEWRLGRGASARIRDKQFPILFQDSKYANRLPIGDIEVIETFPHETLRRFYREWYRPDLMAVVAVGDYNHTRIEELIKQHFADHTSPADADNRSEFPVPDHEKTLFAIATDKEASGNSFSIYYKHDIAPEKTVKNYRDKMVQLLYNSMFNQRLSELTKVSDPPFLGASSAKGRIVRSKEVYMLSASVKDNGFERGLEAVMTEAARIKQFGFTESELERQKKEYLRFIEQIYNERDKSESGSYASEYIRHYLEGEPIPGIAYEYALYNTYMPGIELKEVNLLADELISDDNRVILVDAPDKEGLIVPDSNDLLAVMKKVENKTIEPYVDSVSDLPLIAEAPKPGKIIEEKSIDDLGVTEWKLSNGVRVVLKPTDFKNDEVLFTSFSPGGHSLVPDSDYIAASMASSVVSEGGLGEFNLIDLQKLLAGKMVSVSPSISELQEGISGGASPGDIKTMFELIYLYFTAPRKDPTTFQSLISRLDGYVENRAVSPETAFSDTVQVTMSQYHYRARPWIKPMIDEMNLDTSFNVYRDRFADAGDFTFFFVGNFDLAQIKPLIATYLGGLPSNNRSESWKDVGIDTPRGVVEKDVRKGLEQKSQVNIIFTGPFDWNRENRYALNIMAGVFRIKLREILREDLGGTYGVGLSSSSTHYPKETATVRISFGCAPDRVDELTEAVFVQIDSLKTQGTTEDYLGKVKEIEKRSREKDIKENSFWLQTLQFYAYHNEDPLSILAHEELLNDITLEDIRETALRTFDMNNYVKIVLYPEDNR